MTLSNNVIVCKLVLAFIVIICFLDFVTANCNDTNLYENSNKHSWKKCTSHIFCEGELLHDVQMLELFIDSKTFVDFKLKFTEKEVTEKYKELKQKEHGSISRETLTTFVDDNFEPGNELVEWSPLDWTDKPRILNSISSLEFKKWASFLNDMWKVLARQVKKDVFENPNLYSLIYVPNGFIIPGGRFKELYYWDTYWIIKGLLLCDMNVTVKGIIENLLHLVKLYGHIPNGSRIYYISRSQPPLLIPIVNSYYKATNDLEFIKDNIKLLDEEFHYWLKNHMVVIQKDNRNYRLARYFSYDKTPRPESYKEDYNTAHNFNDINSQEEFYIKIRSAAETGWDFSSRWFVKDGKNEGNLTNVATPQIIPVDLNSFLHSNAEVLSKFYWELGNHKKAKYFKNIANSFLEAITEVLWHEHLGTWLDYDCENNVPRNYFYISNLTPLYTHSYPKSKSSTARSKLSKKVLDYLNRQEINYFIGGVPTSLENTGEQWDFPNAWAPLQSILIIGLDNLGTDESKEEAYILANKWLQSNYKGYNEQNTMYEKYDVLRPGETGEGGEYVPQTGFGWTNGVIFEFLSKYGDCVDVAGSMTNEQLNAINVPNKRKCRAFNSHVETNAVCEEDE